jgi:hypothetical protein
MDAARRTAAITRAATRLACALDWAPLAEVTLVGGRRADILALRPDGGVVIVEVKSGPRDYLGDAKWRDYGAWCDAFFLAVDLDFPQALLPEGPGLIVTDGHEAAILRAAPEHPLAPARRRALVLRCARLAARRLALAQDPAGAEALRGAGRLD